MLMSTKSGHCHGIARFLSILSCSASLSYTSISAGVIVAVTFEQVDGSPDAKACSKGHHQGLQYSDCAVEKCHIRVLLLVPGRCSAGLIWFDKQKCPITACAPAEKDIKIARVRFNEHRLCSILLSFRLHVVCQTSPYSILKSISDFFLYALKILISQ